MKNIHDISGEVSEEKVQTPLKTEVAEAAC